jgi:hypothetical protein
VSDNGDEGEDVPSVSLDVPVLGFAVAFASVPSRTISNRERTREGEVCRCRCRCRCQLYLPSCSGASISAREQSRYGGTWLQNVNSNRIDPTVITSFLYVPRQSMDGSTNSTPQDRYPIRFIGHYMLLNDPIKRPPHSCLIRSQITSNLKKKKFSLS